MRRFALPKKRVLRVVRTAGFKGHSQQLCSRQEVPAFAGHVMEVGQQPVAGGPVYGACLLLCLPGSTVCWHSSVSCARSRTAVQFVAACACACVVQCFARSQPLQGGPAFSCSTVKHFSAFAAAPSADLLCSVGSEPVGSALPCVYIHSATAHFQK